MLWFFGPRGDEFGKVIQGMSFDKGRRGDRGGRGRDKRESFGDENFGGYAGGNDRFGGGDRLVAAEIGLVVADFVAAGPHGRQCRHRSWAKAQAS